MEFNPGLFPLVPLPHTSLEDSTPFYAEAACMRGIFSNDEEAWSLFRNANLEVPGEIFERVLIGYECYDRLVRRGGQRELHRVM